MSWLPAIFKRKDVAVVKPSSEVILLEERKLEIAERQADALHSISEFLNGDGLQRTLSGLARSGAANSLLQGLVAHDGRNGLDARTQEQNAREICHLVEKVFDQFQEKLQAKANGEVRDSEIHDAEAGFKEWKEKVMRGK